MAKKFYSGIDLASQKAVNAGDPTNPADLVTKSYVDNLLAGLRWKEPVKAATTGNITLSGTQTVDGVSLVASDRVLVKDQSTGSANGIYVVSAGAWSRATDADSSAELDSATVMVQQGTANGDKAFTQTANAPTVGTTSLVWTQVGGGNSYAADGNGLELSGVTFSLELDGTTLTKGTAGLRIGSGAAGNGLTEASGVLAVNTGSGLEVSSDAVRIATSAAGTGLTGGGGSALAVDTSVVVRKYAQNVGAMSAGTPVTITHNLNTTDVTVGVYELSGGAFVDMDVKVASANTVTLTTAAAQSADTFRVIVHG
jgi:hypothetical protein